MFDGEDLKEGDLKAEAKKNTRVRGSRGSKGKKVETPPSEAATAKVESGSPTEQANQPKVSVLTTDGMKKLTKDEIMEGKRSGTIKRSLANDALRRVKLTDQTSQISPVPEKLAGKTQAIATDQIAKDQATAASIQQNVAKGGDTVTTNTVGGNSTTFNIVKGGGSGSLSNSHLPVLQSSF